MAIPYSRFIVGTIPWYSVLMVLGVMAAFCLGSLEERRIGLPKDTMIDVTLVAVPCGILGARIYYVVMNWAFFAAHPAAVFAIWEGGIAMYGSIIGGSIGVYAYCRKKKMSFAVILDMLIPGLLLAQAIGRWGNYFNAEAYGAIIGNPAFQFFPLGVQIKEQGFYVWHMATFFYEFVWNVCGFAALLLLKQEKRQAGGLFLWYLLIYGSGRFIIEPLRMDSLWLGGVRISQALSLLLCAGAAVVLLWRAAGKRKDVFAMSCMAVCVAVARWFWANTWSYALLMLMLAALLAGCHRQIAPSVKGKRQLFFARHWIVAVWAVDGIGLLLAQRQFVSAGFSHYLHMLLCSVTLPFYVLWMEKDFLNQTVTVKGESECPSGL